MKIAILADIHANIVALQMVADHIEQWRPDAVIVAGDVVNRGPRPLECLRFVQEKQSVKGWSVVRGNHEDYVISNAEPHAPYSDAEAEIYRNSLWTYQQLNGDVTALEAMPFSISLTPNGSEVRVAHASMRGARDGIYVQTPDSTLREQIGDPPPPLFCVGHTHKPLKRYLNGTLVVNVGAAGLPFDGDPRAAYAQIWRERTEWKVEIVRLDYDRAQAEQDFVDSGILEDGGALARLMRVELRHARSQIAEWVHAYQEAVAAGEIGIDESVSRFVAEQGLTETGCAVSHRQSSSRGRGRNRRRWNPAR
jgi:predicted phosphodiesterase